MSDQPLRHAREVYTPFDVGETRTLRRFVSQVETLADSSFFKDSGRQFTIRGSTQSASVETELPHSDEALRAMLPIFRQLYSHNEPASASAVLRMLKRHANDMGTEIAKAALKDLKSWQEALRDVVRADPALALRHQHTDAQGRVTTTELTPRYVIDLWLNGEHFHWGNAKTDQLESWPLPDATRYVFFTALVGLRNHYWGIANVVREVLKHDSLLTERPAA